MKLIHCIPSQRDTFFAEIASAHLSLEMVYALYGLAIVFAALLFVVGVLVFGRGHSDEAPPSAHARGERATPVAP